MPFSPKSPATATGIAMGVLLCGTLSYASPDAELDQMVQQLADTAHRGDAAAMAGFYYADNAADGRLGLANARRIVSALALKNALAAHVSNDHGRQLVEQFGLINEEIDLPASGLAHDNGDVAVATAIGPDAPSVWFKKIDGHWKIDITPDPPVSVAQRTQDLEDDDAAVERITTEVNAGKLKTLVQVRDALGDAMLNAETQGAFGQNDMRLEGEPLPQGQRDRPDPHGNFPSNPTTPAGAMNQFVAAIQKGDQATLRDSLYMPQDRDGACAAASANDYVVGLKLLAAAESRFPNRDDSNRVAVWLGALIRDDLRGYTNDEWRIEPGYPNLVMSSWETIPATDATANGQQVPVHEMTGVPTMHRCPDGKWRIGPRFPQNARQIKERTKELAAKDLILDQAAADLKAGKYATDSAVITAVAPRLKQLGSQWGLGGYSNSE